MKATRLFHEPISINNSFVYIKIGRDLSSSLDSLGSLYIPLNATDNLLQKEIASINEELIKSHQITSILLDWETMIQKKLNLLGTYYLQKISAILNERQVLLSDLLIYRSSAALNGFKSLPRSIIEKERVNICIPVANIDDYFDKLSRKILSIPTYFEIINRIEIAQAKNKPPVYPTLIVYFNEAYDSSVARQFVSDLNSFFDKYPTHLTIDNTFADSWNDFVNVTQRFKLFKVYFFELNILDQLYSESSNIAYISDHEQWTYRVSSRLIKHFFQSELK